MSTAILALLLGWSLATPLFAAPDEPAHVIRAAAVGRGELGVVQSPNGPEVVIPTALAHLVTPVGCFEHRRRNTGDCHRVLTPQANGTTRASTAAGYYQPTYYLLVGWPLALWPNEFGVYAVRFVSATLCALLISLGLHLIQRPAARLAAAAALTPTTLFLCASVNPSALEISAMFLVWSSVLRLAIDEAPPGLTPHALGLSSIAATATRPLAIVWVLVAVVSACLLATPGLTRRVSTRWLGGYTLAVLGVACEQWLSTTGSLAGGVIHAPQPHATLDVLKREEVSAQLQRIREMIGTVGWNDLLAPSITYGVWLALCIAAVITALSARAWMPASLVIGAATAFVCGALALDLTLPSGITFFWQGRYNLPVAVGLPLLLVVGIRRFPDSLQRHRSATMLTIGILLAIGHGAAFFGAMHTYREADSHQYRVTDQIHMPLTIPATALFLIGAIGFAWAVARSQRLSPTFSPSAVRRAIES